MIKEVWFKQDSESMRPEDVQKNLTGLRKSHIVGTTSNLSGLLPFCSLLKKWRRKR
jgi:hypothetical protein